MYSDDFDYFRPKTLAEAARLLQKHKGARLLAGGHSLLPAMKFRLATPEGARRHRRHQGPLAASRRRARPSRSAPRRPTRRSPPPPSSRKACPVLAEAAAQIGDLQVRNRGTIGGSIAHADPAADFPTVLVALGATIVREGPEGRAEDRRPTSSSSTSSRRR